LADAARVSAAAVPSDPARRVPRAPATAATPSSIDSSLLATPADALAHRLRALERRLRRFDRRLTKVLHLAFDEDIEESLVANSTGLDARWTSGSVGFSLEVLGEHRGDTQVVWDGRTRRRWADLPVETVVDEAAERLVRGFGAGALPSGRWPVLLSPRAAVDLLAFAADALSARAVQRGRSCFAGRMGRPVASPLVTWIDDASCAEGAVTAPVDDEGVPTFRRVLVEGGRLIDYFHDTETSTRDGRARPGSADRESMGSPPVPGPSNMFWMPGRLRRDELIAGTPRAFWVEEMLGLHTADPVSGSFSVGASGFRVERGRLGRAVRGVTLAGNLLDLFRQVDAVADDVTWFGAFGAPTVRVKELSLGGS
jgi:PmbA protein